MIGPYIIYVTDSGKYSMLIGWYVYVGCPGSVSAASVPDGHTIGNPITGMKNIKKKVNKSLKYAINRVNTCSFNSGSFNIKTYEKIIANINTMLHYISRYTTVAILVDYREQITTYFYPQADV